jgi:hypothetical protein
MQYFEDSTTFPLFFLYYHFKIEHWDCFRPTNFARARPQIWSQWGYFPGANPVPIYGIGNIHCLPLDQIPQQPTPPPPIPLRTPAQRRKALRHFFKLPGEPGYYEPSLV